jgi:hypothetical protein
MMVSHPGETSMFGKINKLPFCDVFPTFCAAKADEPYSRIPKAIATVPIQVRCIIETLPIEVDIPLKSAAPLRTSTISSTQEPF